jgi:hypothetical protein
MLRVDIPAQYADASGMYICVEFDPEAFEAVDWDASADISGNSRLSYYDNNIGYLLFSAYSDTEVIDLEQGMRFTALMRAKDNADPGRYDFTLTEHNITDAYDYSQLWPSPGTVTARLDVTQKPAAPRQPVYGGGLALSSDLLHQGDRFNVVVTVPPISDGDADKLAFTVKFDSTAFDVLQWAPDLNGAVAQAGSGYFSLASNRALTSRELSNGFTFTALLQVRSSAATGSRSFTLTTSDLTCYDISLDRIVNLWRPTTTSCPATVYTSFDSPYIQTYIPQYPATWQTSMTPEPVQQQPASPNPLRSAADEPADSYDDETPESIPGSDSGRNYYINENDIEIDIAEDPVPDIDDPDDEEDAGIVDIDDVSDDDDPDDGEVIGIDDEVEDIDEDDSSSIYDISLDCEGLDGLTEGTLSISTKYRYFSGDTVVYMTRSDLAETCAKEALKRLGMTTNPYYSLDISVFDKAAGRYITAMPEGGSITFEMPLPAALSAYPDSVEVFHAADGRPEPVERTIVREGSLVKLRFTGSSFSPYLIVDTDHTAAQIRSSAPGKAPEAVLTDDGAVPHNGNLNPATGAAAAVALPAAAVFCVILAKKSTRKRKRTRTYVGDSVSSEDKDSV